MSPDTIVKIADVAVVLTLCGGLTWLSVWADRRERRNHEPVTWSNYGRPLDPLTGTNQTWNGARATDSDAVEANNSREADR